MRRIMLALLLLALGQPAQATVFAFAFETTDTTSLGPPFAGSPEELIRGRVEVTDDIVVQLQFANTLGQGDATGLVPAGAAFWPTDNVLCASQRIVDPRCFFSPAQLTTEGFALDFANGAQIRLNYNLDFALYQQTTCTVAGDCTATLGTFRADEVLCGLCIVPAPPALPVLAVALGGLAAAWATGRRGSAAG
jgi:hypothetical protein